mmetsp:Transcript_4849/g.8829  ORF Transcript_4849/g.8829 Transcript_4849/m.8829 type:complete len:269 (-) Transcript_4849:183-989(-)
MGFPFASTIHARCTFSLTTLSSAAEKVVSAVTVTAWRIFFPCNFSKYSPTGNVSVPKRSFVIPLKSDSDRFPTTLPFLSSMIGKEARFQSLKDLQLSRRRKPVSAVSLSLTETTDLPCLMWPRVARLCVMGVRMLGSFSSESAAHRCFVKSLWLRKQFFLPSLVMRARWRPLEKYSAILFMSSFSSNFHNCFSPLFPINDETGCLNTDRSIAVSSCCCVMVGIEMLSRCFDSSKQGLKQTATTISDMLIIPPTFPFDLSITGIDRIPF